MPAKRKRPNAKRNQPTRPEVFVIERGANIECEWTPQPPVEHGRFPKYVDVAGGTYDATQPTLPDSIKVGIMEGDPDGRTAHFTIYVREAAGGESAALESFVYVEDVREVHAMLGAAIEQAEQLGILPPCKPIKPELRVGPFEYTGERGAGGRWVGRNIPPRENRVC